MSRTRALAMIVLLCAPVLPVAAEGLRFEMCGGDRWVDCVVDGDTFHWLGERVRIENIDAPELGGAKCAAERELAQRASDRLIELLNEGGWRLVSAGDRDEDRYGRKLRRVVSASGDVGQMLINEHLARPWVGRRAPWCGQ